MERVTKAELQQRLDDTMKAYGELEDRMVAERGTARELVADKDRDIASLYSTITNKDREIDRLKDELHAMELERSRLEGYRDRVQQFDPITERQAFFGVDRDMGREHRLDDFSKLAGMAAHRNGASIEVPPPYYRRRA